MKKINIHNGILLLLSCLLYANPLYALDKKAESKPQAKQAGLPLFTKDERGRFVMILGKPPAPTCADDPLECKGLGGMSKNLKTLEAQQKPTVQQIKDHKLTHGWLMPQKVLPTYLKLFKRVNHFYSRS